MLNRKTCQPKLASRLIRSFIKFSFRDRIMQALRRLPVVQIIANLTVIRIIFDGRPLFHSPRVCFMRFLSSDVHRMLSIPQKLIPLT